MVSFTPRPLYLQGKSPCYPLDRRLGGPQSWSARGGEEKNFKYQIQVNVMVFYLFCQREFGCCSACQETPTFIGVFTWCTHQKLSWATSFQFTPSQSTSFRSILILSFYLYLVVQVFSSLHILPLQMHFLSPLYVLYAPLTISFSLFWRS
jgi:hypothetical protein